MFNILSKKTAYGVMLCAVFLFIAGCAKDSWIEKYGIEDREMLRSPSSIPALVKALEDPDLNVRNRAIRYLRGNNNETAIGPAKNMAINDPHTNNRTAALAAFLNMPVQETEKIAFLQAQAVRNSDDVAKKYAMSRLSKLKKQNNITKLIFKNGDNIEIKIDPNFYFFNGYKRINISSAYGILPITITIRNHTDLELELLGENVVLLNQNGVKINTVNLNDAIRDQSYSHGAAAVLRGPWSIKNSIQANAKIENFCRQKYLGEKTVLSRSKVEGVLFFVIDKNNLDISNKKLKIMFQANNGSSYLAEYVFGDDTTVKNINNSIALSTEEEAPPVTQVSDIGSVVGSSLFHGVPEATKIGIKKKCEVDSPGDFSSQADCARKQVGSWKILNN